MRHVVVVPIDDEREREDPAVIAEVAIHVGRALPRDHRLERRRLEAGHQPLRHCKIGDAAGADATAAPGLPAGPFDSIVEVGRLGGGPRISPPGRLAATPGVDAHCSVSARHPPQRIHRLPIHVRIRRFLEIGRRHPQLVFLVGTEVDDDRETSSGFWTEDVSLEPCAVAHRNLEVLFDDEIVVRLRSAMARFGQRRLRRSSIDLDFVVADDFRPRLRLGADLVGEFLW